MHKIQKARNSLSLPSQIRFHANNFRLANRQRKKKKTENEKEGCKTKTYKKPTRKMENFSGKGTGQSEWVEKLVLQL